MRECTWTNRAATVSNGEGTELVIDKDDLLWLVKTGSKDNILLGPSTKERVDQLITSLQQLRTVCR